MEEEVEVEVEVEEEAEEEVEEEAEEEEEEAEEVEGVEEEEDKPNQPLPRETGNWRVKSPPSSLVTKQKLMSSCTNSNSINSSTPTPTL